MSNHILDRLGFFSDNEMPMKGGLGFFSGNRMPKKEHSENYGLKQNWEKTKIQNIDKNEKKDYIYFKNKNIKTVKLWIPLSTDRQSRPRVLKKWDKRNLAVVLENMQNI